ncbi:NUDIX hydrolase [Candidatus Uhrbacteria bacterium]|nr:NUDIX hydrolase [Candidatus Uhrbacteria bacterium]
MAKIRTLSSETVHSNPWFRVRHDRTELPDGSNGNYFVIEREPYCLIVAEHDNRFMLIEEDRYTSGTRVLDFPGGWIEPGEEPGKAALRELEEEAGYRAEALRLLTAPYASIGYSKARCYIYTVTGKLERVGQKLEASEEGLKVLWMTRQEIAERLARVPESSGDVLKCLAAYDMFR